MTLKDFISGKSLKDMFPKAVTMGDELVFRKFRITLIYWTLAGVPLPFLVYGPSKWVTFGVAAVILLVGFATIFFLVRKGSEKKAKSVFIVTFAVGILCLEVLFGPNARGIWLICTFMLILYAHFRRVSYYQSTAIGLLLFWSIWLFQMYAEPLFPIMHTGWYDGYIGSVILIYFSLLGFIHMQSIQYSKDHAQYKRNELLKLNADLMQHKAALERANLELHQFASCASHDMREPLRTISSFSSLVKKRLPADDKNQELLEFVTDGAKRMTILLDDLISYTRVTQVERKGEWIDLNLILSEVRKNLYVKIAETETTIDAMHMPTIKAEKTHMLVLFQNFLSNSIKYSSPDRKPHITIKWIAVDEGLTIIFKDNGIGIEKKWLEEVFEPFRRLHPIGKYEGSGIGLATCRKIIDYYCRSTIYAESEYGYSTTITAYLEVPFKPVEKGLWPSDISEHLKISAYGSEPVMRN
jgi:signal transduction histidine kinase